MPRVRGIEIDGKGTQGEPTPDIGNSLRKEEVSSRVGKD